VGLTKKICGVLKKNLWGSQKEIEGLKKENRSSHFFRGQPWSPAEIFAGGKKTQFLSFISSIICVLIKIG